MKPTRVLAVGLIALAAACCWGAQTDAGELYRTCLAAGASALEARNWPEAETFFTAAAMQTQTADSKEPYLKIARYSLAATYAEEGKEDDAIRIFKSLKLTLNSDEISQQTRQLVDTLLILANHFYSAATAETKDATNRKLEGDALQKINDDISEKYQLARRYYQWIFVIDKQFLPVHSPDLQDVAGDYGLASYYAGDYISAKEGFEELLKIVNQSTRRQSELSQGSLAYSLAAGNVVGPAKTGLSVAAISVFLSLSYEGLANELTKDKPAEAAQDYSQAESYLTAFVRDPTYGNSARTVLTRLYRKHAELLRHSGQIAKAIILEGKATDIQHSEK